MSHSLSLSLSSKAAMFVISDEGSGPRGSPYHRILSQPYWNPSVHTNALGRSLWNLYDSTDPSFLTQSFHCAE